MDIGPEADRTEAGVSHTTEACIEVAREINFLYCTTQCWLVVKSRSQLAVYVVTPTQKNPRP